MKKSSMIARSSARLVAALTAMRKCEPSSSPFVYQVHNARSLLITQRSCSRGALHRPRRIGDGRHDGSPRLRRSARSGAGRCSRAGTAAVRAWKLSRRAACEHVLRLREDPRVAQHAPANKHAADAKPHAIDDLLRLDAVAESRTPGSRGSRQSRRRSPSRRRPVYDCFAVRP